jgi:hypothetical protein
MQGFLGAQIVTSGVAVGKRGAAKIKTRKERSSLTDSFMKEGMALHTLHLSHKHSPNTVTSN